MKTTATNYRRHRFPPEIISHSVWLYHRFPLSFRDVEELLAERGVIVSYETIGSGAGSSDPSTHASSSAARVGWVTCGTWMRCS